MNLLVDRIFLGDSYTIGKLYINGEYFCDTLEDTVRDLKSDGSGKVYGETAIPSGEYAMVLTRSPRFKRILPRLLDVPFFEGILMHAGNYAGRKVFLKILQIKNKLPENMYGKMITIE